MAEGDSIARLAARLERGLVGRRIASSRFQVPALATADLSGWCIGEVASRGKHLLVRLAPPDGRRPRTLHLHLRMDGRLQLRRHAPARLGPDVRLVLDCGDVALVGLAVPVVELVETAAESAVVGHLGPDLCAPGWSAADAAEAASRLAAAPDRPVVEALLDQRNLAGIGNLYAIEGCWLAGLFPWTPIGALGADRLARLVDLEHRLLAAGVAGSGQATTGDRRPGMTHWVYGRKDRPCRRCGTPVRFRDGDGSAAHRPTWWCPSCQPPPVVGAEGLEPSCREAAGFKPAVSAVPPRARGGRSLPGA